MKKKQYKDFSNYLVSISNNDIEELKKDPVFYAGYLWLQLTDDQCYDLIEKLKGSKMIVDISCDGEDYYYHLPNGMALIDNRQRKGE